MNAARTWNFEGYDGLNRYEERKPFTTALLCGCWQRLQTSANNMR